MKNLIEKYKKLRDKYLLMSSDHENEDCIFWGNAYRIYKDIVEDLEGLG